MKTVLIVEDDRDVAELQRRLLDGLAVVTIINDDFRRALRPETWLHVDIAVIDLMLPGVQGEDICRYLMLEQPHIRRVICTAKSVLDLPELQELADVVLHKPFRIEDFLGAVLGRVRR